MVAEDVARGGEGSGVCALLTTQGAEGRVRRDLYASRVWLGDRGRKSKRGAVIHGTGTGSR